MATPSRLDDAPTPARPETPTRHESLVTRLVRLGALELELGWAETRNLVIRVAIAVGVAVPALIALLASIIVIVDGALASLFATPCVHIVNTGGNVVLIALAEH